MRRFLWGSLPFLGISELCTKGLGGGHGHKSSHRGAHLLARQWGLSVECLKGCKLLTRKNERNHCMVSRPPTTTDPQRSSYAAREEVGRKGHDGLLVRLGNGIWPHQEAKANIDDLRVQLLLGELCGVLRASVLGHHEVPGLQRQDTTCHPGAHDVTSRQPTFLQASSGLHQSLGLQRQLGQ